MVIALIVVALAMVVAGLVAIAGGSEGIGFESGWAMVIAGTVASTGGVLVLALAFILRELRSLPDRLEAAHPLDDVADQELSPFENLPPAEARAEAELVPPAVKEPAFKEPAFKEPAVKEPSVREPSWSRPAKPVDAPAAPSGFGLPPRDAAAPPDAEPPLTAKLEADDEASAVEPVDKAPPVFPDFSPRALLEASRAKAKKRTKSDDPDAAPRPHGKGERVEPTLPLPPDMLRSEEAPDVQNGAAGTGTSPGWQVLGEEMPSDEMPGDDAPGAASGRPQSGKPAGEPAKESTAIVGTYRSNGTVYVMYADGSIEADTPEGVFRFGSLEELKAHIAASSEQANDKRLSSPA